MRHSALSLALTLTALRYTATRGHSADRLREVAFDQQTGRFEVSVSPSPEPLHENPAGDSVRQAIVSQQSG